MRQDSWLAARFEESRPHLSGVAYRLLGSREEADDAVQESWIRLSRSDPGRVENLTGWLTTIVARVCLDMLRSRRARPEDPAGTQIPESLADPSELARPDQQAVIADSIGSAMLVVLDTLSPPERVAFVLHDIFGVSFEEIAPIIGKTAAASRQLGSRARRRVQGTGQALSASTSRQRAVVDAFLAAHPPAKARRWPMTRPPAPQCCSAAVAESPASLVTPGPGGDATTAWFCEQV